MEGDRCAAEYDDVEEIFRAQLGDGALDAFGRGVELVLGDALACVDDEGDVLGQRRDGLDAPRQDAQPEVAHSLAGRRVRVQLLNLTFDGGAGDHFFEQRLDALDIDDLGSHHALLEGGLLQLLRQGFLRNRLRGSLVSGGVFHRHGRRDDREGQSPPRARFAA